MPFAFRRMLALLLLTHLSVICSQQFDTVTGCVAPGTRIVLTKTLSCPCYLGYSLYSPQDTNVTTDFLLLPTGEYTLWRLENFTNTPSVIRQHSTFNASTTSSLFKTPIETSSGSYTFVIRTHASTIDCSIRLFHLFTAIPTCTNHRGNKIIGGAPMPHLTKHMAMLESVTGYCSGTLITSHHILTAAHCNAHSGIARIGTLTSPEYEIASFHTHPLYRAHIGLPKFDIGIATLSRGVNTRHGSALRYARAGNMSGDVLVSGFGQTHERVPGTGFRELHAVKLALVGLSECRDAFSKQGFQYVGSELTKGMMCLGGSCGDSCHGDSGGAALIKSEIGYVVVGVVSSGIGCGRRGLPGVYTNVMEFAGWVEVVVGEEGVVVGGMVGSDVQNGLQQGNGGFGWIGFGVVVGLGVVVAGFEGVKCGFGRFEDEDEDDEDDGKNVARRWFRSNDCVMRDEEDWT